MNSEAVQMLVILTAKPGKLDDIIALCEDGAAHHKELATCTKWLCSRELNPKDGAECVILLSEWTSAEDLMDHSTWDYSVRMRDSLAELTSSFEYKMSKVFVGFSK